MPNVIQRFLCERRGFGRVKTLKSAQSGLSLIELMIAVLISAAMLTTLLQSLNSTYLSRSMLVAKNQIQLNGTHAMRTLSQSLRYNSYEGCKPPGLPTISSNLGQTPQSISSLLVGATSTTFPINDPTAQSLLGFDVNDSGNLEPAPPTDEINNAIAALNPQPRSNSSIVLSYNVSDEVMLSSSAMSSTTDSIGIANNTLDINEGDYVLITDCFYATIFQARNTPNTTIQHDGLNALYGAGAQIRRVEYNIFYVGDTNRRDVSGEPIYALYLSQNSQIQELAEGVMLLRVEYQAPRDNQRQYLSPAAPVLDISEVRMVQIGMLVASISLPLSAPDDKQYAVLSEVLGPTDLGGEMQSRGIKQVFTGAVKLRNRG
jgi:type IV pilus assembly protein PilW